MKSDIKNKDYDEKQFDKIVKDHKKMIIALIKNLELEYGAFKVSSEDLYQEGLIALHDAYKKYDSSNGTKFSTFAYMVIKRKLNKFYFQSLERYRNEMYSIDSIELFDHHPMANNFEVHDSGINYNASIERVDKLFIGLKPEDQNIVALRCLNNTYNEIAKKLNISKKKVDSRLSRLRIRFKEFQNCQKDELCV